MKILIAFESVEGQTRKIAQYVEDQIRSAGHDVETFDTRDRLGSPSFDGIDKVVLAAPVHERRHPETFEVFVSSSRADLQARPSLLISVSLKAAFREGLEEAQDFLIEMKMRTEFEPAREVLVAGAVRANSYDYFQSQIVNNVLLEGHDVELVDGVQEFTNWEALSAEIRGFLSS